MEVDVLKRSKKVFLLLFITATVVSAVAADTVRKNI